MRIRALTIALAACGAPSAPNAVVANRATDDAPRPQGACPSGTLFGWEHEVWPACPPLPFRYDFDVCNGRACPHPCRVEIEAHEPNRPVKTSADASYDERGRLVALGPLAGEFVDGARCTYDGDRMTGCGGELLAYDARGRISVVTHPNDKLFGPRTYTYDERGRIRSSVITRPGDTDERSDYHYDDRGRLSGYDYEASGIHEQTSYRYGSDGRLAQTDNGYVTFDYHYDARGRIARVNDGRGQVDLTYDARDRLVRVVALDDPAEQPRIHTYIYDCR